MTRHYATVCHERQLPVLFASMVRHCQPFVLHALAWDHDANGGAVSAGADLRVYGRRDFLSRNPSFAPDMLPGPPRSAIDTVATVRWAFFAEVMRAERCELTTLDGDMWFWSSPDELFDEIGLADMAVCPHGIPPASFGLPGVTHETHHVFGKYNSGMVHLGTRDVAVDMARRNHQWSYTQVCEHPGGGINFGDQGHLERVADEYGAHVVVHPGVNAAPWNIHQRGLRVLGDVVHVGHRPLVCYHYSSLHHGGQLADAAYAITPDQQRILYEPYLRALVYDGGQP